MDSDDHKRHAIVDIIDVPRFLPNGRLWSHIQSPTTDAAAPNKTEVKWTSVTNPVVSVGWFNPDIISECEKIESPTRLTPSKKG